MVWTWPLFLHLGKKYRAPGSQDCCPNKEECVLELPSEQRFVSLVSVCHGSLRCLGCGPNARHISFVPGLFQRGSLWSVLGLRPHFSEEKQRDLVRQAEADLGSECLLTQLAIRTQVSPEFAQFCWHSQASGQGSELTPLWTVFPLTVNHITGCLM